VYKNITTLAAVFAALNMSAEVKPDVSAWPERYHQHKIHEFNIQMAIDAINGPDWVADWNDTDQYKYIIWWDIISKPERASGRGLSLDGVFCASSSTFVGPRLVFRSREHARHFAEHFLPLMESYYLGE
jgi:hypothetical protein